MKSSAWNKQRRDFFSRIDCRDVTPMPAKRLITWRHPPSFLILKGLAIITINHSPILLSISLLYL